MKFSRLFRHLALTYALLLPSFAIAESQPKGLSIQKHVENKRASAEGRLERLLKSREQAVKYNRATERTDNDIAQVREELAIMNSGKDPETINLELQILKTERNKKIYQKSGHDTAHLDRQIENYKRRLRGEPLSTGTLPSIPKTPPSTPAQPSSKPKPPLSDKMRQHKIKALQNAIRGMESYSDKLRADGKPVPQHHLDNLARKKAELAELEK